MADIEQIPGTLDVQTVEDEDVVEHLYKKLKAGEYTAGVCVFVKQVDDEKQQVEYWLVKCDIGGGYQIARAFLSIATETIRAQMEREKRGSLDG